MTTRARLRHQLHDPTRAQVSVARLLHEDVVTAPIIDPKGVERLDEHVGALDPGPSDVELARRREPIDPGWSHSIL